MNLIVDIGNSSAKVALVQDSNIIVSNCFTTNIAQNIAQICHSKIDAAIISSTRKSDTEIEQTIRNICNKTIIFDHTTPTPLTNLYQSPETLGMDRLAAAVGAWSQSYGKEELLIFDFGTAITIDKVSEQGEYLGGNISPGMSMRFAALNNFTEKLPLVSYDTQQRNSTTFGTTTVDAIWKGVVYGIEHEIRSYTELNPTAKIFFTGRDAKNFATSPKSTIFVDYELVIKGLDRILHYLECKEN